MFYTVGTRRHAFGVLVAGSVAIACMWPATASSAASQPPQLVSLLAASQGVSPSIERNRLAALGKANDAVAQLRAQSPPWFAGAWMDSNTLDERIAITSEDARFDANN